MCTVRIIQGGKLCLGTGFAVLSRESALLHLQSSLEKKERERGEDAEKPCYGQEQRGQRKKSLSGGPLRAGTGFSMGQRL